jgi:lipopolysaccharide transport system ATP-binding protein
MRPAIVAEQLSKRYRLGANVVGGYRTLRESVASAVTRSWGRLGRLAGRLGPVSLPHPARVDEGGYLWALKDVSLEVAHGEVVGIIGRNGSGKSTLLKVLSRITQPTAGRAELRGRVGSLLEVGTGFHSELTGRENIYLNGSICGLSRREITRKFDSIVDFSEVAAFLDTPVKRYSSGMYVRLAFAVACHMAPEILLVDEVLAVGDQAFQKKCLGKMDELRSSGRTVLFVSHNMASVLNLCKRVAVLAHGRLQFVGDAEDGVRLYVKEAEASEGAAVDLAHHPNRRPGLVPVLGRVRLLDERGEETTQFASGGPIIIELEVVQNCPIAQPHFAVGFEDTFGSRLFTAATYLSPATGRGRQVRCRLHELPLAPGRYALTLNAGPQANFWADMIDQAVWFDVVGTDFYGNGRIPNAEWGRILVRSEWRQVK